MDGEGLNLCLLMLLPGENFNGEQGNFKVYFSGWILRLSRFSPCFRVKSLNIFANMLLGYDLTKHIQPMYTSCSIFGQIVFGTGMHFNPRAFPNC